MIDKIVIGILNIAKVCVTLVEMLVNLLKNIAVVLEMVPLLFNPVAIVNDAIVGAIMTIKVIVISLFNFKMPFSTTTKSKCEDNGEGLFGYRRNRDKNGKLTGQDTLDAKVQNRGCVKPTSLKLILTILCPPLGLFLHLGMKGFFQIFIAAFLTVYAYYFPGLMFVLLHILC